VVGDFNCWPESIGRAAPASHGTSLPVVLEMLPELRPGGADVAADVDLVAVAENVVGDSIRIPQLCGVLAGGEDLVELAWLEADGNHGLGRRVAVAA